jgi:hypothetical protein
MRACSKHSSFSQSVSLRDFYINTMICMGNPEPEDPHQVLEVVVNLFGSDGGVQLPQLQDLLLGLVLHRNHCDSGNAEVSETDGELAIS